MQSHPTSKCRRIVVLGGGFAGLWSAAGAARKLDELALGPDAVEVLLINRDAFHNIRVRNYEAHLDEVRVPLDEVLDPIGVRRIAGDVIQIDVAARRVVVATRDGSDSLTYDRVVFALGSQVARPPIPGLEVYAFDVDTYAGARRLEEHLATLASRSCTRGRFTALVVGAGLTGIEVATELGQRLAAAARSVAGAEPVRVILADHSPTVGSDMGPHARPVIEEALAALHIETRLGVQVAALDEHGATLADGHRLEADTIVWCAGMRASPLTTQFGIELDRRGRLPVDEFLRVRGVAGVLAAGDSAWMMLDAEHTSVMSCQHGRPMGRFAGHNAVCDLLGLSLLPLEIDWYVTVLDLGPWGALYTQGWDRRVVAVGPDAQRTKQTINCERIYPPRSRRRDQILAAAAPIVQRPPDLRGGPSC